MQVTKENIDALNAIVKLKIEENDYTEGVEKELKTLRNKAFVPGFRAGKVPPGMIRKMYGKSVLVDEVSKLAINALFKYLKDENIQYLGDPLPNREQEVDWDGKEFDLYYDLGLIPDFNFQLPDGAQFIHYSVKVAAQALEDEITRLRERYGRSINGEVAEPKDLISGEITELDENGAPLEGGLVKKTYFFADRIVDEETRNNLLGKTAGDEVRLNPRKAYEDDMTASIYLGIKQEEMQNLGDHFNFKIESISRVVPAELDQEFFDRLFGEGAVTTEEDFRSRIEEYLKSDLQSEATAKLFNEIRKGALEANTFDLPDAFLKRWIVARNADNEKFDPSTVEPEYPETQQNIRWEVIRNKILEENKIEIPQEELAAEARRRVQSRLSQMGYSFPEERMEELVKRTLENREEYEKIVNYLYEIKSLEWLKNAITVKEEEVGYEEFLSIIRAQEAETPA